MAKLTGALMSLGARGSIAKTLTFASARGVPYVRQTVIPSNPRTTEQTLTRDVMRDASNIWKNAPALLRAPWDLFAQGRSASGRALFIGEYISVLRGAVPPETTRALMTFSPGAKGGVAPVTVAATPGVTQLSVLVTPPSAPTGWVVAGVVAAALGNVAPDAGTFLTAVAGTQVNPATPIVLTGLTAAQEYVVGGWVQWTRPVGFTAYGASLNDTATPT